MISISKCKKILTLVWMIGFLIPFLLLGYQTLFGSYYQGKEAEAWGWFSPIILPTIGLIVGVLVADAMNPNPEDKFVSRSFFWVTLILSLMYLVLVNSVFFLGARLDTPPLELFKKSNLVLGPLQGLVTATIGVFFINKNAKPAPKPDAPEDKNKPSGKDPDKKP